MKNINILKSSALALILSASAWNVMADTIDPDDFIEDASAKGIAEIDGGKLALQKSTSTAVRTFAQKMIDDHTATNKELADIAKRKKLEIASDAELVNKAKAFALKQREGESFDAAYAKSQVTAHENAIELFQKAAKSSDADISSFATAKLPTLEQHLHMAHDLSAAATTIKSNTKQ